MKFITEIWHPNVDKNGDVCISILHEPGEDKYGYEKPEERWLPIHTVETIMISVISMLADPNGDSPANVDAAAPPFAAPSPRSRETGWLRTVGTSREAAGRAGPDMAEEEVAKLEKHLMLLRQEYVKLQKKLAETEKRCTLLAAQANKGSSSESFISRLLAIVAGLYEQEQYSDLKIKVEDRHISAHKFVLAARSDSWSLANLSSTEELDLSDANPEVAMTMLRWIYTDELEFREDDVFLTELMKLANRFQLQLLRERQVTTDVPCKVVAKLNCAKLCESSF
ncbi:Rabankyrin-5 [Microtus ochrogaster]|uniref:Rabankyrin-5 n=1 Tax=Microtus ochrogaster TaxID=79684 RepID=A0A8J6GJI7_MICOH|nr:Rabankyrin-5 [Microtus ochrogaster]